MTILRWTGAALAACAGLAAAGVTGGMRAQERFPDPFGEPATTETRWIHEDLERGYAEAEQSGKPLLVVFRCVP